ncbi:hypothetical protein GCM10023169_14560 [Georgenia halophila]|uniref:Transcriptional regulator, AbiEi antitoxin, Type IV TA system n=1 Tax=Georgenia halophila TaxID=620889 RepID=A0ABP8L2K6_9MICO
MPRSPNVDLRRVRNLAGKQDGVLTRGELLGLGATPDWMARQVRLRRWCRLYPGVYLARPGPPSWRARARAALLYAGDGAVLSHRSAAYRRELTDRHTGPIEVLVPHARRVTSRPGLVVRRREKVPDSWGNLRTTNPADTILDIADLPDAGEDEILGLLGRYVRSREDADDVLATLRRRRRHRRRALVEELCAEVGEGVESPLELRYHRGARRHGLPRASLQVREVLDGLYVRADARYEKFGVRIELDGRRYHDAKTDDDIWRDNAAGVAVGDLTLRYRWLHLVREECAVTLQVARALRLRGWTGLPTPCGPACPVARIDWRGRGSVADRGTPGGNIGQA